MDLFGSALQLSLIRDIVQGISLGSIELGLNHIAQLHLGGLI